MNNDMGSGILKGKKFQQQASLRWRNFYVERGYIMGSPQKLMKIYDGHGPI